MRTKVKRWGNSLGVRIPQGLAESLGIVEDTAVELSADKEALIIKPLKRKESLGDLVKKITPENIHAEIDWGSCVGREVW